ncbi:carbohydrate ABC transporter permease [Cellulosimicrobium cellulans]|jgi:sn-glycerol 3-phosphate transport system permease protein|uniref:carbohydrate ABC transporter permease n=1 Tax=Cellulosimicrobium cellulans TaxID=1710 RepID=UPI003816FEF9|nr:transporter permease subunit [Mycobacterium sp.]
MSRLRSLGVIVGLTALTAVVVFPLYYAIAGSVMNYQDLTRFPPALIPTSVNVESFGRVFESVPLARQYLNSIVVACSVVAAVLITSVLAGYAFTFLDFPYKKAVFGLTMATLMVPAEATILPNYLTISGWGLLNTYPGLFLPFLASGFGIFLMRQFFLSFPRELYEAARVEGSSHLRFVVSILVPLSKPALSTLAIYTFIVTYNQYFWPLLVTNTPKMQTLQIGLSQLSSVDERTPNVVLAGVVLAVIPMLVILYVFQRQIVRGLTQGAVK